METIELLRSELSHTQSECVRLESELRSSRFIISAILKSLPGKEYKIDDFELVIISGSLQVTHNHDNSITIKLVEKGDERVRV